MAQAESSIDEKQFGKRRTVLPVEIWLREQLVSEKVSRADQKNLPAMTARRFKPIINAIRTNAINVRYGNSR